MSEMRPGVVAIVDALGFKGIWKRTPDATAAIRTLQAVTKVAQSMRLYCLNALVPLLQATAKGRSPRISVVWLSDSVVIAAELPEEAEGERTDGGQEFQTVLLDMVCQAATYVMRNAAKFDPPLVYRGVVAAGLLAVDEAFLIGPAVDEAAELERLAEGAFVWLAESALKIPEPDYHPRVWKTMAVRYPVPLKGRTAFDTIVLSPYVDTVSGEDRRQIRDGYERAMPSTRIDVQIKKQNTLRFLDHVDARAADRG
jgi:hypothetical protein